VSDPEIVYYYPKTFKEPWRFAWISFSGGASMEMTDEMTSRHGPVYNIHPDVFTWLIDFKKGKESSQAVNPAEGAGIVLKIFKTLEEATFKGKENSVENTVSQAMKIINDNLESGICVAEVAKKLCVSREHLSRMFKDNSGLCPSEYILRQKMRLAGKLLTERNLSCKEAACVLGYENSSNFSRAFTKFTNMTPKEFRKQRSLPFI